MDDTKKTNLEPAGVLDKKRWERPTIETGELFESNSLSCGKLSGGLEMCIIDGITTS